jgi:hypothetical protein
MTIREVTDKQVNFMKDWMKMSGPVGLSSNPFERTLGSVVFTLYTHPKDKDTIFIRQMENLGIRGKGRASKALKKLTILADKHGVSLILDPKPFGSREGLNRRDLGDWYKRNGFTPRKNNYWIREPL